MSVCVLLAAPSWSPGTPKQHPRELFDTNNTRTIMFDPLNIMSSSYDKAVKEMFFKSGVNVLWSQ